MDAVYVGNLGEHRYSRLYGLVPPHLGHREHSKLCLQWGEEWKAASIIPHKFHQAQTMCFKFLKTIHVRDLTVFPRCLNKKFIQGPIPQNTKISRYPRKSKLIFIN